MVAHGGGEERGAKLVATNVRGREDVEQVGGLPKMGIRQWELVEWSKEGEGEKKGSQGQVVALGTNGKC